MRKIYSCFCFAIPTKMFRKLAAASPDADRHLVHSHMRHSEQLRSLRHASPAVPTKPGKPGNQRRNVFDLDTQEVLPGRLVRGEDSKPAEDPAANEAFANLGVALDFYREVFGWSSVDGRGMDVDAAIHYGEGFRNAMWNGSQMIFGDGDETIGGFTGALDIIAHELTHGVTQHLIPQGLGVVRVPLKEREFKEQKYSLRGQSGALNESLSDVVGSMAKQWHASQTVAQADWLIGEKVLAPVLGRAIRSLESPGNRALTWNGDDQMKSMAQYENGCDVHDASGIPNHAFYQAATKIGGCSWEKAGPIWLEAYSELRANATFAQAARATIAVADAWFGPTSLEAKAVTAAWREVKVT